MTQRRAIAIRGTVQGVGFRPFVYRLASSMGLAGFVQNNGGSLTIEIEGEPAALDEFLRQVIAQKPPLACIGDISWKSRALGGEPSFRIKESDSAAIGQIVIAPDTATCEDCLHELFDPANRRCGYAFINCTNCGPRLTIVSGAPYDRASTTMASFVMCPACRAEYENPLDRRFHAQPNACADCGPRLTLRNRAGQPLPSANPLADFAAATRAGKIGALKGIGGYHLVCDARNSAAVAMLRQRKHRDEKPFAIMVGDLAAAQALCDINPREQDALTSSRRPIVLLQKHNAGEHAIAAEVAPHNPALGIMLPYSPIHHLLMRALSQIPLVMTSGNRSDEPIAFTEPDALERLAPIADIFLTHNRPIHIACDDSVIAIARGMESPIRRARGYAPSPIELPLPSRVPLLALGGQQKSTFALATDRCAILSHHLGDLDHLPAAEAFEQNIALYEKLFSITPAYLVHDLHPDYSSTRYAARRHAQTAIPRLAVQHHHAHMASCMAEHQLNETVIGVTFDGTGLGTDGAIWGGEFLIGGYRSFRRAAHLRYVAMPGSEIAVREPWRMALAHLHDAGVSSPALDHRIPPAASATVRQMIERRFNSPWTSSAGRLFDAVASLAGIRDRASYEGQAAVELEAAAGKLESADPYPFEITAPAPQNNETPSLIVDTRPMIREIAAPGGTAMNPQSIARRFHSTLAHIISEVCTRLRTSAHTNAVVFSGGVFMNRLLSVEADQRLTALGFRVYHHHWVPANDGGLALGQLAVAIAQLSPAT